MNLRRALRMILPGFIPELYERIRKRRNRFWEGVYPHIRDVPRRGPGLAGENWIQAQRTLVASMRSRVRKGLSLPDSPEHRRLLPLLISCLAALNRGNEVTILDFGGGLGCDYLVLESYCPALLDTRLTYHVMESSRVSEAGIQIYGDRPRIRFHSDWPPLNGVTVAYVNSALQYLENYEEILNRLMGYRPRFLFLVRLDAGLIPTHARCQINVPDSKIPCWFFNLDEILRLAFSAGYHEVFRAPASITYSESNLPPKYRIGRPLHLLLSRSD